MAIETQSGPTFNADAALKQDYDATKALEHAREHASTSKGECAKHVRQALQAGGVTLEATLSAKNYGPKLLAAGFVPALNQVDNFRNGDVVVIQGFSALPALIDLVEPRGRRFSTPTLPDVPASAVVQRHSQHGHMAIYDEENDQWISDFKQKEHAFPGSPSQWYDAARPAYRVYRYIGNR